MNIQANFQQSWSKSDTQPAIAIIGAGMSGIAAVVKLRKEGYTNLTVFEKADKVGGTWRENTYPGLSCDVPSRWYSFSFALNPDWTHRFSYGPEIQSYMEKVADEFGVTDIVRFNTPVAKLDYEAPRWRLETGDGRVYFYDIVISATGVLHNPVLPNIEGMDSFNGDAFHSAQWDHSVTLEGKKVGVIGTGSTAAQIIGEITDKVGEMNVFQRTPQWMAPLPQKKYSKLWKRVLKTLPFLQRIGYHYYYQMMLRTFAAATIGNKKMQNLLSKVCLKNLQKNISDPNLRAKLTPNYQAACKRLIFCSNFYPAMSRDNAHLITAGIERITAEGVQTVDGEIHELDVLIYATGFDPSSFILPTQVTGENGQDLASFWDGAPRAHRAVSVPAFPNFWMLEGPTGPVGNLSLITITENQVDYIIHMLNKMKREGLSAIAVKKSTFADYNAAMSKQVKGTVWVTGGCNSWYIDKTGTPNLYPFEPRQYLRDMQQPVFAEYRLMQDVESKIELARAA